MRQGSDILGKSIFVYDTGKTVESVRDLVFDHNTGRVLGFLVAESGWFRSARILPLAAVKAIGPSGIITADQTTIVSSKTLSRVAELLREDNVLRGTEIMTTDGRNLGTMVDLFFDDATGLVEGYEVSGGLFADAYSGRSFVPALQTLTIGEDVAFVSPETADLMEEQVGGVLGALQSAGGRLQEAGHYTGEKLQEAGHYTGEKFQAASQYTSEKWTIAAAAAQKDWEAMTQTASEQYDLARRNAEISITNAVVSPEEQQTCILGKITQDPVLDNRDRLLFPAGLVITAVEVQQASDNGVLDRLYRSTGGDIGQDASDRIQLATQAAKAQFQTATQSAKARLDAANQQASQDLQSLRHDTLASITNAAVAPDRQRAYALGKTVDRDICALDGRLLISEGAVATAEVVALAESADMLNELYRATGGAVGAELTQQATGLLAAPAVDQTLGRRASTTVHTSSGSVIVAAGQIVTELVIERARTAGQEQALMAATGIELNEAYRLGASQGLGRANERIKSTSAIAGRQLQTGANQLQAEAATLWTALEREVRKLAFQTQQFIENRRIQSALGRPVTRVILDEQDQVILNVGDLITHKAIDRAREADSLEILLGSVYDRAPELMTRSDLRAPARGEAALVRQS